MKKKSVDLCKNCYDQLIRYVVSRISNSKSMNVFYQYFSVSVVEKGFFSVYQKKSLQVLGNNDGTICQNRIHRLLVWSDRELESWVAGNATLYLIKFSFYFRFFQIKISKFWCINLLWLGNLRNKFLAEVIYHLW